MIRSNLLGLTAGVLSLMCFSPDESNTAVADPTPAAGATPPTPEAKRVLKTPNPLEFAVIYNKSNSREDALKNFQKEGFKMTYGALVARQKSYSDPDRPGGPIALKEMPASPRGRRINTEEINAKLAEMAAATVATDEKKEETPAAEEEKQG